MGSYISRKPKEIEAVQWTGTNADEVKRFVYGPVPTHGGASGNFVVWTTDRPACLWVEANRAWLNVDVDEWIVKDSLGFYPIKNDMFIETYMLKED